jgi:phospholipid/cholesterol/gamma-HCH transport system substrate-binding protein
VSAVDERKLELQVGLLALLALLAGFLLWALFEGPWRGGSSITLDLADSAGLTSGAPVKMAGVPVGRVRAVELLPERRDAEGRPMPVKVALRIDSSSRQALVSDARFVISSAGVLGEPYVEIVPGSPGAQPLPEGAEVRGEDPIRVDRLLAEAQKLIGGLSSSVSRDPHALGDLLAHVDTLVRDADDTLREVRPGLTAAVADAQSTATEARALAQEARPLLADLREKLPGILEHASALAEHADTLSAGFSKDDVAHLKTTAAEAARTTAQLQGLLGRADRLLAGLEAGDGTAGRFLKDPKLFDDLKAMIADLKAHPWKVLWR